MQSEIDHKNSEFWNELCGTGLAQHLGIKDHSLESLQKFDETFFDFYPYLLPYIPLEKMQGKRVLEIGLGYGTLGQKIAQSGAIYTGLDIALKPVSMMNHRLSLFNLEGSSAKQGSILHCPIESESQDYLVSIGCFHHTGNLARAIEESHRVLKKGGTAIIMVYNQYSFREWVRWPISTLKVYLKEKGWTKAPIQVTDEQKAAYDANLEGVCAPETVFSSISGLKKMFASFSDTRFVKENWDEPRWPLHRIMPRKLFLSNLAKIAGLDIYITAKK